jgi:uncharacterized Zn-finger protein
MPGPESGAGIMGAVAVPSAGFGTSPLPVKAAIAKARPMDDPFVPEISIVTTPRVACDGTGPGLHPALGHPRIYLQIDEKGFVDCGYCDRRFILKGGPADVGDAAAPSQGQLPGDGHPA